LLNNYFNFEDSISGNKVFSNIPIDASSSFMKKNFFDKSFFENFSMSKNYIDIYIYIYIMEFGY